MRLHAKHFENQAYLAQVVIIVLNRTFNQKIEIVVGFVRSREERVRFTLKNADDFRLRFNQLLSERWPAPLL